MKLNLVQVFGAGGEPDRPPSGLERAEQKRGLWFVSPWIAGLVLLYTLPLVISLVFSFTDYQLVDNDNDGTAFVGFDNWRRLFSDPDVAISAKVTVKFAVMFLPVSIGLPLGFAYLLNLKQLRLRSLFRTLFFMPSIVPFISTVFIWRGYLNGSDGWANRVLGSVGLPTFNWLSDPQVVLPTLALMAAWGVGNAMVIFTAALNGVSRDLYEAATLDGAGRWHQFRHVTWPLISPVTFYNVVIALVALGQYFLIPFAMSNGTGDPDNATLFYTMYFYRQTFNFFDAGYGATLAWAMFGVVMALTLALFWSARYWVHYQFEERS